ncbi:MAG TPA: hypothetical protein VNC50_04820 [Planctomycetia bacterium]|nr:hypothetical protein [Planctomycetia bacterium]
MNAIRIGITAIVAAIALTGGAQAGGRYFEVAYPPSDKPGELQFGVDFTLWLPDGAEKIRGVIVHQHGCGSGACKGGATAAYDLHWQALAKKWNCALLGPSYQQEDKQNCRLWCDPRTGSEKAFLRALDDLAVKTSRPEIAKAPWCLWGHSGGGYWASIMQTLHPERIVAIWFRSGTAYSTWEKGEIPKPALSDAIYAIPMMLNPGAKERDDKRFAGAWNGSMAMFKAYRAKGAPAGFAPDPRTGHECGDCRYLAIPFFDACLAQRLPAKGSSDQTLRPVDGKQAWLAPLLGSAAEPAASFGAAAGEANWLPDERTAKAWAEYVKTGWVSDSTEPPAPVNVKLTASGEGAVIAWDAAADFESGIRGFIVERDGMEIARLPEKPIGRFGKPLFQTMSYHDTPEKPLPELKFVDRKAKAGEKHEYRVFTINGAGAKSAPSEAATGP